MTIPYSHLGAWTMCLHQSSQDELHLAVVDLAETYGFRVTDAEAGRHEAYRAEVDAGPPGQRQVSDPVRSGDLGYMARRALDWLNEHAPADRWFTLTDALYCVADPAERPACDRFHPTATIRERRRQVEQ